MRLFSVCAVLGSISLAIACVGGPGSADQGGDNGDQYGGIGPDTSGNSVRGGSSVVTTSSGGRSSSGVTSSSGVSTSGGSTSSTTGGPPPADLRASDYDQGCAQDSDCRAVYQGAVCATCQCPNSAISRNDFGKYTSDSITRRASCPASAGDVACAPCPAPEFHCDASKRCAMGPNPNPKDGG